MPFSVISKDTENKPTAAAVSFVRARCGAEINVGGTAFFGTSANAFDMCQTPVVSVASGRVTRTVSAAWTATNSNGKMITARIVDQIISFARYAPGGCCPVVARKASPATTINQHLAHYLSSSSRG